MRERISVAFRRSPKRKKIKRFLIEIELFIRDRWNTAPAVVAPWRNMDVFAGNVDTEIANIFQHRQEMSLLYVYEGKEEVTCERHGCGIRGVDMLEVDSSGGGFR